MRYGKSSKGVVLVLLLSGGGLLLVSGACVFLNLALPEPLRRPPKSSPAEIFRRYVLDPIPKSVTDIKADQPKSWRGYGYVLRFAISRSHLNLIIRSRPFREAKIVACSDTTLLWAWKDSSVPLTGGFSVYQPRQRTPSWFNLGVWGDPEVYVVDAADKKGKNPDIEMLIYNSQLGQAYFIIFD